MAPAGRISGQFHIYSINYSKVTLSTCSKISSGPECCCDRRGWHDGHVHLCAPLYSGAKCLPPSAMNCRGTLLNQTALLLSLPICPKLLLFFPFWSVAVFCGLCSSFVSWMKPRESVALSKVFWPVPDMCMNRALKEGGGLLLCSNSELMWLGGFPVVFPPQANHVLRVLSACEY